MPDLEQLEFDLANLRARRDKLVAEADSILQRSQEYGPSDGEMERLERLNTGASRLDQQIAEADELWRSTMRNQVKTYAMRGGYTEVGDSSDRSRGRDNRRNEPRDAEMIQRAHRVLDHDGQHALKSHQLDAVDRLLRAETTDLYDASYVAGRVVLTENEMYRSAFVKYLAAAQHNRPATFSAEEANALDAFDRFEKYWIQRTANETTTTAGGFGVPAFVDPSIIITSGAADAPILRVCRIEQVTNNLWKGISSAGMSWSYDTESAEVSDDTATLAQPTVTVHMARGYIPYSIEVSMDYSQFASEMGRLLNQGYSDLIATKTMTGTGTGEPWGIFTAIDQTAGSEVTPTTDGAFGGIDVFKTWNALPERYRSRATWVMSVHVESAVRQFAAAAGSSSAYFTVDLTAEGVSRINGRPVMTTDYAPTFSSGVVPGTTGAANILIVGDFSNYLMASRAGMSIEAVPHVFATGANRPSGERALFAWARNGFDSVNDRAFILLQNQ